MRKLLAVLFLVFGLSRTASAQTPQHFVVSGNAAGYGGTQAVSIEGAGFQVTKEVSVAYGRISNPADSTKPIYNLGDLNYTRQLDSLLGAKLAKKLAFDSSNLLVTFQVSGGKITAPGVNRIAEGAGIYLTRPVANNLALTSGFRFLHGAGNTIVKVPSIGMQFTF